MTCCMVGHALLPLVLLKRHILWLNLLSVRENGLHLNAALFVVLVLITHYAISHITKVEHSNTSTHRFRLFIHHTAVPLLPSTLDINERNLPPVTIRSVFTVSISATGPVASWESATHKSNAQHRKPLISPRCGTNLLLLYICVH